MFNVKQPFIWEWNKVQRWIFSRCSTDRNRGSTEDIKSGIFHQYQESLKPGHMQEPKRTLIISPKHSPNLVQIKKDNTQQHHPQAEEQARHYCNHFSPSHMSAKLQVWFVTKIGYKSLLCWETLRPGIYLAITHRQTWRTTNKAPQQWQRPVPAASHKLLRNSSRKTARSQRHWSNLRTPVKHTHTCPEGHLNPACFSLRDTKRSRGKSGGHLSAKLLKTWKIQTKRKTQPLFPFTSDWKGYFSQCQRHFFCFKCFKWTTD